MYSWFQRKLSRNSSSSSKEAHQPKTAINSIHQTGLGKEQEESFYGVTDQLIEFVKSLTADTFKNFSLPEEQNVEATTTSGGVRMDLSEWQQQHATIVLSKVKEVSQLRYMLCPRHLKEREFWRIYFTLVKSFVTEYELQAIQLEKLTKMAMEDDKSSYTNPIELEMSEAKHSSSLLTSPQQN